MNRDTKFAPNEFYHLYNRGVDKRVIFNDHSDHKRFITLLYICNGSKPVHLSNQEKISRDLSHFDETVRGDSLVDIITYCLMPNHFHILMREKEPPGTSKFMQKLSTAYTMYFNKRNSRSGTLFQGKFKAKNVSDDTYLRYLTSYIHLNPVSIVEPKWKEDGLRDNHKAESFLSKYDYSSYKDYLGINRIENKIINTDVYPKYFNNHQSIQKEMKGWLSLKEIIKVGP